MLEKMLTVGIDLGTSTTQLVLSELTIENLASAFSVPRITISDKRVIYRSDIIFTPLLSEEVIDAEAIKTFVSQQYHKAGIKKEHIQMGAVIITGETARKENSALVLEALSGFSGDFVVATAGPDLESIIAAKGAGAHTYSEKTRKSVVNLDIGGGTTNLAVFTDGELIDTACFDIGGRLVKINPDTREITFITEKIKRVIASAGWDIEVGQTASVKKLTPLAQEMACILAQSIGAAEKSPYYEQSITHHGLTSNVASDYVSFSGGVADCIAVELGSDPFEFGDMGQLLGWAIAQSSAFQAMAIIPSVETIRATVVGAGSHTAEISGSTISYTGASLPLRNLPVLKLTDADNRLESEPLAKSITEKLGWYKVNEEFQMIALGFEGEPSPSFTRIQSLAKAIVTGLQPLIEKNYPVVIVVAQDMAKALGQALFAELPQAYPFVCLDSVKVENGDYIDIGLPVAEGKVLPVIVKTLVFN
ncbi:Ethanolamine reactivating factor for ammonia lyase eutBC [Brochothrix thermosphacta]|uniref:ethanolamine ammonia-lyase reactivating factor EutA n=1 Tax=Brochothrix thermosphacta TaxID=2756 RepID=UPI000D7A7415|nr:ethanolamine ammonia-lyase reactivating factor EutA [Brochothrix thermosphacta]ANZ97758.1 ethanolamine ammonia-lyase [Brochothrix thermosphacta]SPP26103.1 Ethanolamine reactivating factor for ammonia lyase eutBC [Brochothrix thermosphacta]